MRVMSEPARELLLLGGHRAIDFLNTWRCPGVEVETLTDGAALGAWLVGTGHFTAEELARLRRRFGAEPMDAAAAEARRFREWAREWLARWRRLPGGRYARELTELNRVLSREDRNRQVFAGPAGLEVREVPEFATASALVALPAADVAELVTREDPDLIRECAGDCTLWFLDRTKSHRRRFCSAAICGNRAKVAAFRERQRG
jgi:predicted RNA-binding Zn ribbon-like protein